MTPESNIFGYRISRRGIHDDIKCIYDIILSGEPGHYLACANPHSLVVAASDPLFRDALQNADLLVPDGVGVLLASKLLKDSVKERVAGFEVFKALSEHAANHGGARYFFLGSSRHVLDLIATRMQREFPFITICGTYSPPFRDSFSESENKMMIEAINQATPDVLWVGMTAPKQEKWIYQNRNKLKVPFIGAIGAVFDFYAGTKKRSSPFWQKLGLEWLPRFLKEPRRLLERNLKSTPIFLWWVLKEKLKQLAGR
ncbi:MAG: WecB/TagA/CpsF family glycosyltransferase [Petrimonas sp.]|nr:WecB/TagA/CpsF family glycosyltransferase [Petrimonas sp.]MEA5112582.1 WecB/TagA/CpsF family glycosyltransferase [Geobacteraceae bacterium]